jgi:toxin ParE1/3/4
MTLRLTDLAERDLIAIWHYIAIDNPQAADILLDDLGAASRNLEQFPSLGPSREDLGPGVRYLPCRTYLVLYRQIDDGIEIIRYLHGDRDLYAALTDFS